MYDIGVWVCSWYAQKLTAASLENKKIYPLKNENYTCIFCLLKSERSRRGHKITSHYYCQYWGLRSLVLQVEGRRCCRLAVIDTLWIKQDIIRFLIRVLDCYHETSSVISDFGHTAKEPRGHLTSVSEVWSLNSEWRDEFKETETFSIWGLRRRPFGPRDHHSQPEEAQCGESFWSWKPFWTIHSSTRHLW